MEFKDIRFVAGTSRGGAILRTSLKGVKDDRTNPGREWAP
jgi:hypothetical protein